MKRSKRWLVVEHPCYKNTHDIGLRVYDQDDSDQYLRDNPSMYTPIVSFDTEEEAEDYVYAEQEYMRETTLIRVRPDHSNGGLIHEWSEPFRACSEEIDQYYSQGYLVSYETEAEDYAEECALRECEDISFDPHTC